MKRKRLGVIVLSAVILLVAGAVFYFVTRPQPATNTAKPLTVTHTATPSLLKPLSLGYSPYQYVAYSGSIEQTKQATNVSQYFAAFMLDGASCMPAWGGNPVNNLTSQRALDLKTDFVNVRADGGNVAISFGGADGTELAVGCKTSAQLADAYDSVITAYGVDRVDFDIENTGLSDTDATLRRAEAVAVLQKRHPTLQIWVTLPVRQSGLTVDGENVIRAFINSQVKLNGINIMAMNYNQKVADMGQEARTVANASVAQIAKLYPKNPQSDIWKALGITVMVGNNNTPGETFTLADAASLRTFAEDKSVGTLSIWNALRDAPCSDPNVQQPSPACSGLSQPYYEFSRILAMPPRD